MKSYRLRKGNRVIGYAKENEDGLLYKAYNDFHWHDEQLDFDQIDESIGLKDKRHRTIFEGDVVLYLSNNTNGWRRGWIDFDQKNQPQIVDEKQHFITPLNVENYSLFEHEKLEVVSHRFSHQSQSKIDF